MGTRQFSPETLSLGSRCYRLTARGQACVDIVESEQQTIGSLSRYLHDVLMMCGSGAWFEQLRQFMPPRSLEESLQALLALELIERVEAEELSALQPRWCSVMRDSAAWSPRVAMTETS
ncbi:MAG: hypothetical protein HY854_23510 [Burkholderiales bacterium]|nr:hypothetical protein [Burkholderiales bacterium]